MKTKKLQLIAAMIIAAIIINNNIFAQDWLLGGNLDNGANGLLTNSNFWGATQTASLKLGTGNTPRIFIGGTSYANPGFVGIGRLFTTPASLLHLNGNTNNLT